MIALFLLVCFGHASIRHETIAPALTQSGIVQVDGEHEVWTPQVNGDRLLLSLGGTGSRPSDFRAFDELAAKLNYFVIGLDYQNAVITTVCRASPNRDCFDTFREEIIFGHDVNPFVRVDAVNSIANRARKLLEYLVAKDPRWAAFWDGRDVRWDKVTLVGHSQGAGHVAFLSKRFPVARVIMIAGPQDAFTPKLEAPWLDLAGLTSPDRYFALLHQSDVFGSAMQLLCFTKLIGRAEVEWMRPEDVGHKTAHVVVSQWPTSDPHTSVITPIYQDVWEYFLR